MQEQSRLHWKTFVRQCLCSWGSVLHIVGRHHSPGLKVTAKSNARWGRSQQTQLSKVSDSDYSWLEEGKALLILHLNQTTGKAITSAKNSSKSLFFPRVTQAFWWQPIMVTFVHYLFKTPKQKCTPSARHRVHYSRLEECTAVSKQ